MRSLLLIFFLYGSCLVYSKPDKRKAQTAGVSPDEIDTNRDYVPETQDVPDLISPDGDTTRRRKTVVHKRPYNEADISMELFRETLSRHVGKDSTKSDPCRYMRCTPGEECDVQDGRAKCVCKRHCKQRHNPICGTDDEYYENHCEMHRHACITGGDIYDARHKDCFYKASECSEWEMKQYLDMMMQFYGNVLNSVELRHDGKADRYSEEELVRTKRGEGLNRRKRSTKRGRHNNFENSHKSGHQVLSDDPLLESEDLATEQLDISSTPPSQDVTTLIDLPTTRPGEDAVKQGSLELLRVIQSQIKLDTDEEEIKTKDSAGEMVKYIFALMDLDASGKVGSDEVWEITSLQHLDNVLPGPCSLFHVLKYGDENNDRTLDISETFKLFNVSVLRLSKDQRYARMSAMYGTPARMQCGIDGEDAPIWRRYGREIEEKNGARINGRILYLNDVTSKKAGNYTCTSKARETMTQTIDLRIMVTPRVEVHPRSQHPMVSSSATIKCHAEGRPRPIIRWERNGEELDTKTGKYILMANNTELHFNSVDEDDSAAYSCFAENSAGVGEDVGAMYVQKEPGFEGSDEAASAYFVFHQDGISVVNPHMCQTARSIQASEKIPGLLLQDKLCNTNQNDVRECIWGESVLVGFRFIYAAQPTEDRIVVVDKQLQRVVEVISTDVMPVQLYYVQSTDQVFVLCWIDGERTNALLQVVHSAAIAGTHSAEHIRPVAESGHRQYDRNVYDFFVPPESTYNPTSQHGYVLHKNDMVIQRLDLSSLTYGDPIDLSPYGCVPIKLNYLPIGGLLDVSCVTVGADAKTINEISIDVESGAEVHVRKNSGVTEEYFSYDYSFVVKISPQRDMITLYNITDSGEMNEFMIIRTNFQVADAYFSRKKYNPEAMIVYMISKNQGNIMYVDLEKKKVEVVDGLTTPSLEIWPWRERTRKLTASGWFGWFLASAGRTGMEILGLNSNQVLCRMDHFVHATAVSWSSGDV